jgi:hypothetical protein
MTPLRLLQTPRGYYALSGATFLLAALNVGLTHPIARAFLEDQAKRAGERAVVFAYYGLLVFLIALVLVVRARRGMVVLGPGKVGVLIFPAMLVIAVVEDRVSALVAALVIAACCGALFVA